MPELAQVLHIVATGSATSIGACSLSSSAALRGRINLFREYELLVSCSGEAPIMAFAPYLEQRGGVARMQALLDTALMDCFNGNSRFPEAIPCVICLPQPRPGFSQTEAVEVARQLPQSWPQLQVSTGDLLCQGHAGGYAALPLVQRYLQAGHSFCLLAGVDSYVDGLALDFLQGGNLLHHEDNPYGFVPGEGAGCVLMCNSQTLHKHKLVSLGTVYACASSDETKHSQGVCTGEGLTQAIEQVMQARPAELQAQQITQTICDLNGQMQRVDEYGFALTRLSQHFIDPGNFITPADCWGDVGAATGPLSMALTATKRPYVPLLPLVLQWAASFGALRSAVLMS